MSSKRSGLSPFHPVIMLFSSILTALILSYTDEKIETCQSRQQIVESRIYQLSDSLQNFDGTLVFKHPLEYGLTKDNVLCPSKGGFRFEHGMVRCTLPHHNRKFGTSSSQHR